MNTHKTATISLLAGLMLVAHPAWSQLTWTKRPISTTDSISCSASANSQFYLGGDSKIFRSADGQAWTAAPTPYNLSQPVFGGNTFAATSFNSSAQTIYRSPNGQSWYLAFTAPAPPQGAYGAVSPYPPSNAAFTGTGFAAVDQVNTFTASGSVTSGRLFLSDATAVHWTTTSFSLPTFANSNLQGLYQLAFGGGVYVVVADVSNASTYAESFSLLHSSNGTTWTIGAPVTAMINQIAYNNGIFVAVGDQGKILTSPDGATWTTRTSGTVAALRGIAFGKATWVAVGSCGTLLSSTDNGVTWKASSSGTFDDFHTVTFGNNTFLAGGDSGLIEQSN